MNVASLNILDQKIRRTAASTTDVTLAADQIAADLMQQDLALVLLFCSPSLSSDAFAGEIAGRFPEVPVVACTTAGEITPFGHRHGSITGVSLAGPDFHAAVRGIPDVRSFSVADGRDLVQNALADLRGRAPGLSADQIFAMLLIDGLDACEESVVSAIHRELGPIPLFGGSAADELAFKATRVLWDSTWHRHSAALVLVATNHPFRVFKTEQFASSGEKLVVTAADPARRTVREINAEPAAEEYARRVGVSTDRLTPMIFANYPVVVRVGNMPYVRSIQKVNADGSLTFFCAIDEGVVFTIAKGMNIETDLSRVFEDIRRQIMTPELIIGCDCILRSIELDEKEIGKRVSDLMIENNVVGFNTYGEQFHAMHVNQTFTGVAIGRRD
ncbi:FIST N-terminal domain-containing protein [Telmatospirillum siberiense]|uniref:FIST domain containing protein n=1 Tax=Telmatospirillum siberiense TaxID=382514 RepID=A0A2N3PUT2_9PROT|nr:FIST N-terminal domain-containing protein [Telmatospirillum siberiense]PKU24150.1 FIST domain containing protein [Telmatospirillum siberiense]